MSTFTSAGLVRHILRFRWVILIVSVVVGGGTYLFTLTMPNYYKATINCVPASDDESLMGNVAGGLGAALKDFGLTKLTKSSGTQYEFMAILFSRQIRDSMIKKFDLIKEYKLEDKPMEVVREEFESNLEINLRAEGNYEITIWSTDPLRSADMCRAFVDYTNYVANTIHRKEAVKTTSYLTERVKLIDSVLDACTDSLGYFSRNYLMFSPQDQAEASAKALAESRAELLKQQTVLGIMERSFGQDDPQTKVQATLVRQLSTQFDDITSKPGFIGNFAIKDAAGIGASYLRVLAEFEAHAKLKAIVLPTLEQAQLEQAKRTPSLIVVDDPVPLEKKDRPRRSVIAAGAALGTALLIVVGMMMFTAWKDFIRQSAA